LTQVWRARVVLWTGALLVGIASTALALVSDWAGSMFQLATAGRFWPPFLLSPLGLVVIGWLTRRFFPAPEGSGIPQSMAMLQIPDDRVRQVRAGPRIGSVQGARGLRGVVVCGASIGREGPTVHVGAAIAYSLSSFARFPHHIQNRGLIPAGTAAGLSAAFNRPLAGIVFSIEEMSCSFEERTSGGVVTAVIIAGMTALALQGNYSYFGTVWGEVEPLHAVSAVLLCGGVGGLLSVLLIRGGVLRGPLSSGHPYLFAIVCGLLLALIGWAGAGLTFGTGYEEAQPLLAGGEGSSPFAPLLKLGATLVSYLMSSIPGGIFAPSLAVGAELAPCCLPPPWWP
jgi:H+/Cl- antiporter ClcA